jgi:hypothetical protein
LFLLDPIRDAPLAAVLLAIGMVFGAVPRFLRRMRRWRREPGAKRKPGSGAPGFLARMSSLPFSSATPVTLLS